MDPAAIAALGSLAAAVLGGLAVMAKHLAAIRGQITPNGGNSDSLGDRIARIEARMNTALEHIATEQARQWDAINRRK